MEQRFPAQLRRPAGLLELGRREEALTADRESVDLYRRLARVSPAAFEPDLARSLLRCAQVRVNLRTDLSEAFASIRESVGLYRRLAARVSGTFTGDLRSSLDTAADVLDVLDSLKRRKDARSLRRLVKAGEP